MRVPSTARLHRTAELTLGKEAGDRRALGFHQNILSLDSQFVHRYRRLSKGVAGLGFDLPTVPRTNDLTALDEALAERPSPMRTDVVQRAIFPVHIGNTNHPARAAKFRSLAIARQLLYDCNFCEISHDSNGQRRKVSTSEEQPVR